MWNLAATQAGLLICLIMQCATEVDFGGIATAISVAGGIEALISGLIKIWEIAKGNN